MWPAVSDRGRTGWCWTSRRRDEVLLVAIVVLRCYVAGGVYMYTQSI